MIETAEVPRTKKRQNVMGIDMPPHLRERLREASHRIERSGGFIVRKALIQYLDALDETSLAR